MERLKEYLLTDKKFHWKDNNCLGFVSGALKAQGKQELHQDFFRGFWDTRTAIVHYRKALRDHGYSSILEALDDYYEREFTLHPRTGMIVGRKSSDLLGYAFGVVYNDRAYFLTYDGTVGVPLEATDLYWKT